MKFWQVEHFWRTFFPDQADLEIQRVLLPYFREGGALLARINSLDTKL